MTERELIYIKTIAECKSFSKAAKKLYMTQPSLSKCVANIEQELGVPIFLRSTKGLTLTYAGERYCHTAEQIINIYEDMQQDISEINGLRQGRVRLGITNYLSSWFLPHVLPDFHRKYPGITISLLERNADDIENALIDRQIDFALLHTYDGLPASKQLNVDFSPICTNPFVIVLPKGNPLSRFSRESKSVPGLKELDPTVLKDEPFILGLPEQRARQVVDMILNKAGIIPNILLTTRNSDTSRRLASAGMGVTIVPWQYVVMNGLGDNADYFSIPKKYKAEWSLSVVTVKGAYIPKACQSLIDICMGKCTVELD